MNRPIEHCYWVVPNRFLAGEYPRDHDRDSSRKKIDALIGAGVTAFIDLTEETEGLLPYAEYLQAYQGISHQRFGIRDVSLPQSKEVTVAILDSIDAHMEQGRLVYVHCWGGVGRTGLIVGCWLTRNTGDGKSALLRLRKTLAALPKVTHPTFAGNKRTRTIRHELERNPLIALAERTFRQTR
jgi:protein-tyrosine phosphatase